MMRTGLLFGSFNPVHIGHLAIANYILEYGNLDEIWFVLSPHNPFKESDELIDETHRMTMLETAIAGESRFRTCDIELTMPRPSYTIDTLDQLKKVYPDHLFTLLMGSDNYLSLNRWKDYHRITGTQNIIVYPRPGYPVTIENGSEKLQILNAPVFDISATMLREALSAGKNIPYLLPHGVFQYISKHNLYRAVTKKD